MSKPAENPYKTKFEYGNDEEGKPTNPTAKQYQVSAWKNIAKMTDMPLSDGTDRHGDTYRRHLTYQPGYFDMAHIVAGLGKTVKPFAAGKTLVEAEAYVNARDRKGRPLRPNWEAFEMDITGPNGQPDGLNEILITDSKGNLKAVNGYTLKKNDYGWKRAYQTLVPPNQRRDKEHQFTEFKKAFQIKNWDQKTNLPFYVNSIVEHTGDASLANIQGEIGPKQIFKAIIFEPVYETYKEEIKSNKECPPLIKAQLANRLLTTAYRAMVVNPILKWKWTTYIEGTESKEDMKEINKITRTKEYKDEIKIRINGIFGDDDIVNECRALTERLLRDLIYIVWDGTNPNDLIEKVYVPCGKNEFHWLDDDEPVDKPDAQVLQQAPVAELEEFKEYRKGQGLKFGKWDLPNKEEVKDERKRPELHGGYEYARQYGVEEGSEPPSP